MDAEPWVDLLPTPSRGRRPAPFWTHVDKSGGPESCWPWRGTIVASTGYGVVRRTVEGSIILAGAHTIACQVGHGPRPHDKTETAHSCHNRACCNPAHLRWATHQENADDMVRAGRSLVGERHPQAKLTAALVLAARADYLAGALLSEIESRYGLSTGATAAMLRGKTWRHVAGAVAQRGIPTGDRRRTATTTNETASEIRRLFAQRDVTRGELSTRFGLSKGAIQAIVVGKTYRGDALH